jgi:hypothetical protein
LRPGAEGDVSDVHVSDAVQGYGVRHDELTATDARYTISDRGEPLSTHIEHRNAGTEIGSGPVKRKGRWQLADEAVRATALSWENGAGPVQVIPLGLVAAVAVEDLSAVVLAVQHVASQAILCTTLNSPGPVSDPPHDLSNFSSAANL